jgi:acetolactate synthase small subunit
VKVLKEDNVFPMVPSGGTVSEMRLRIILKRKYTMEKEFTLSVFTENKIGLLQRLSTIFTRRKINIDSLNASESEVKDVYRFTVVIRTTEEQVVKVVKQIEKQIGVLKAFHHENHEIVYQEIAFIKYRQKQWPMVMMWKKSFVSIMHMFLL